MSVVGTKRTWCNVRSESALRGIAEIGFRGRQVGTRRLSSWCPTSTLRFATSCLSLFHCYMLGPPFSYRGVPLPGRLSVARIRLAAPPPHHPFRSIATLTERPVIVVHISCEGSNCRFRKLRQIREGGRIQKAVFRAADHAQILFSWPK
jgi:hypothetical protein